MNIHILGPIGTYSHEIAERFFTEGDECCFVFHSRNQKVMEALYLDSDEESMAVIPIENSTCGLVEEVIKFWCTIISLAPNDVTCGPIHVCGEHGLPIQHCLATKPEYKHSVIKRIFSHPQALGQCGENIQRLMELQNSHIETFATPSTASSFTSLAEVGDAVICSSFCARINGGLVLNPNFNDATANRTRFHILSKNKKKRFPLPHNKTAILYYLRDEPGAATNASWAISAGRVNITTEHSIPTGDPGVYAFYKEFEVGIQDIEGQRILQRLSTFAEKILILGSYASDRTTKGEV